MCLPGGAAVEDRRHLTAGLGVLDRHDRVGTRRDRRAGRDRRPPPRRRPRRLRSPSDPRAARRSSARRATRASRPPRRRNGRRTRPSPTTRTPGGLGRRYILRASTHPKASVSGSCNGARGLDLRQDVPPRVLDGHAARRRRRDRGRGDARPWPAVYPVLFTQPGQCGSQRESSSSQVLQVRRKSSPMSSRSRANSTVALR